MALEALTGNIEERELELAELIPLALDGPFFYGYYARQEDGTLRYHFRHD